MTFGGDTSLICGGMSLGRKHYIERIGNPITVWTKKEKNVNLMLITTFPVSMMTVLIFSAITTCKVSAEHERVVN